MRRYNVPRLAFINKLDRAGADPARVTHQLKEKLRHNTITIQLPIGAEADFEGIIDLIKMKAYYFDGDNGEDVREEEIPADRVEEAKTARHDMVASVADHDDAIADKFLAEQEVSIDELRAAIRRVTIALKMTPVFIGSAYKNKGVQLLLDGVNMYLPNPTEVTNIALDQDKKEEKVILQSDPKKPFVGLAFKLEDGRYGQLTYMRIYQGTLTKGDFIVNNSMNQKRVKVPRLVRMHSNEMNDIETASAGDIVALFGVECASGDTFTNESINYTMTSMHVPEAVISLAVAPKDKGNAANFSKALNRFTKEDPTFRVHRDEESAQTIISGMGELHLEIYIERMKREYACEVIAGKPQVAYREAIGLKAEFNYTHKKQTGGSGQYGKVAGYIEPIEEGDFEFVDETYGGSIPKEFIGSVEKGFKSMMPKGRLIGFPVTGFRVVINDGAAHAVDSSDNAFQAAARGAFRSVYSSAKPQILEPIMKVSVEGPLEFQGAFVRTIMQRRGMIIGTTEEEGFVRVDTEVPLAEMFGYSTDLRSSSQGKAEYTMEFSRYAPVPAEVHKELVEKYGTGLIADDEE